MPNFKNRIQPRRRCVRAIAAPFAALALSLSVAALAGCSEREEPEAQSAPAAPDASETIRVDQYVVRGEVVRLPDPSNPAAEFMVRHEAIPHYRSSGSKQGMNTMTMPFPVAAELSLEGIAIGDKVELTFEVRFDTEKDSPVSYEATEVVKLPAETELDFSPLPKPAP
jgi:Cu/Ag efflux protein CusF